MKQTNRLGIQLLAAVSVFFAALSGLPADESALLRIGTPVAYAHDETASETFEWSGALSRGDVLVVESVNGKITAKPASGSTARVHGDKRARHGADIDDVQIEVRESDGRVTIKARYPERNNRWHHDHGDIRVDFIVEVPEGVEFRGETVNGGIEASDLRGPVEVSTVNGSINLSTTHNASATTVNGTIRADVGTDGNSEDLEFETVNGSIVVSLPKNADADLRAETVHGSISSDFPVTVQGKIGPKEVSGTLGNGGRKLYMSTVNGSIKLKSL